MSLVLWGRGGLLKQVRSQEVNCDTGYSGMDYLWLSYMGWEAVPGAIGTAGFSVPSVLP